MKLVRTEGIAPSWAFAHRLLGPTCLLFHHVRMKRNGASTGTCALLAVLPRQSVAIYGLDAWSKRKDSHLRSPQGRRVYSALHLLLCHASKKLGARADSHPRPSPYEGAALTAAPSSQLVGRLGNAPSRLRGGGFTIKLATRKSWLRQEDSHLHSRIQSPLSC